MRTSAKEILHYPNFDLLRLLLAMLVIYDHVLALTETAWWHPPIMAVPAFLAISGFLVLRSYETSRTWANFVWKRALRIFPGLLASLVVCLALLGPKAVGGSLIVWLTGGLVYPDGEKNFALWSLAWEELAYLMLAILWMAGAYRKVSTVWLLLAVSLLLPWWLSDLPANKRIILFLFPAFFVGNLAYLHREDLIRVHPAIPWMMFVLLFQWGATPAAQWFGGATLAAVQAFMVVWVGIAGWRVTPFKFPDISYGAYIYHLPVLLFVIKSGWGGSAQATFVIVMPWLVLICFFSWYVIEKPALKLKNWRATTPRVAPAE